MAAVTALGPQQLRTWMDRTKAGQRARQALRGMSLGVRVGSGLASLVWVAWWLIGCAPPVDPNYTALLEAPLAQVLPAASTLDSGDRLRLRVYPDETLGGDYVVAPDGTISVPLLGKLLVQGQTCSELEDAVTSKLSADYLRSPSVTCSVTAFISKKVFVFGEVRQPGAFVYEDNMSVVQAVTLAGGFSDHASPNYTSVVREREGKKVRARVPMDRIIAGEVENLALLPGDIIFVPTSTY